MLPTILRQERRTGIEIGEGRRVGGGGLGAPPRDQVELCELVPLLFVGDQRATAVELIDDLEDRLFPTSRKAFARREAVLSGDGPRRGPRPGSANRRPPALGRERTCRCPVADRPVQVGPLPAESRDLILRCPEHDREGGDVGDVAEQASCCSASAFTGDSRASFPTMRSTALSA